MENKNGITGLGARIKAVRKSAGLNQTQFGAVFDTAKNTIGNYENEHNVPDDDFLFSIHKEYNIDLNWLFSGEGNMIVQKTDIRDKYPDIPQDDNIDRMIECLQVPIVYHALISDFILYKMEFKKHIKKYFDEREEKKNAGSARNQKKS